MELVFSFVIGLHLIMRWLNKLRLNSSILVDQFAHRKNVVFFFNKQTFSRQILSHHKTRALLRLYCLHFRRWIWLSGICIRWCKNVGKHVSARRTVASFRLEWILAWSFSTCLRQSFLLHLFQFDNLHQSVCKFWSELRMDTASSSFKGCKGRLFTKFLLFWRLLHRSQRDKVYGWKFTRQVSSRVRILFRQFIFNFNCFFWSICYQHTLQLAPVTKLLPPWSFVGRDRTLT